MYLPAIRGARARAFGSYINYIVTVRIDKAARAADKWRVRCITGYACQIMLAALGKFTMSRI